MKEEIHFEKLSTFFVNLISGLKNGRVLGFDLEESCACLWVGFAFSALRCVLGLNRL